MITEEALSEGRGKTMVLLSLLYGGAIKYVRGDLA